MGENSNIKYEHLEQFGIVTPAVIDSLQVPARPV